MPKAKTATQSARARGGNPCAQRAIHVDHDKARDRYDVVTEDGQVLGHHHDLCAAIEAAIEEAQSAHGRGEDVVVCVEQPDGHYSLAWSP